MASTSYPRPAFALRYGAVSATCLVLHNVIVIACAPVAGLLGAAAISFCIMVTTGYLLLATVAFRVVPSWIGFARYAAGMATNFPVTTGLLWLFAGLLQLPVALVAPAITLLMVGVNFAWARWAVGRGEPRCAS